MDTMHDTGLSPEEFRQALYSSPFFAGLGAEAAGALAAEMRPVRVPAGALLFASEDITPALYLVLDGELHVSERQPGGAEAPVRVLGPGEALDELQVLAGNDHPAAVRAARDTRLATVDDATRDRLAASLPELRAMLDRLHRQQLFCRMYRVFGALDREFLEELEAMAEWIPLRRGQLLIEQETTGGELYLVISGRVRTVQIDRSGTVRPLSEAGRGELVGEMSFFGSPRRDERVEAVRDAVLVGLQNEEFERLVARRPDTLRRVSRLLVERFSGGRAVRAGGRVTNVAVLAASPGAPAAELCARLTAALAAYGPTLHLNAEIVDRLSAEPGIAQSWEGAGSARLLAWLEAREVDHRFVVYQADEGATAWTRRCMRQADRVLLVARVDEDPGPTAVERALAELEDRATDAYEILVLVHPDGSRRPTGTQRWLAGRRAREHLHLRWDREADLARLGRVLAGRAVGVVLGGGGARGFAHIGVLKALAEAEVPVDYVGGTSMGAGIAAQYAMGMHPDELLEVNRLIYLQWRPHRQLTLPLVSIVDNRLADRCGERVYGEVEIEDLWTPYFCITSSLTTAEMRVHRAGLLRKYVLASASIPVFTPPVLEGKHLLVDGALLNNVPTDVMRRQGCGLVLASEVSVEEDERFTAERVPTAWELLRGRLRRGGRVSFPGIMEMAMRAAMLHSTRRQRESVEEADFCFRPPIESFALMDFERMDEIAAAGYSYARDAVAAWAGRPSARV